MDLDNIIYIIATVVIFVVSLLGQSKKKKAQAPVAGSEEELIYSLNDFEKILERKKEFRKDEQAVVQPQITEPEEEKKQVEEKLKTEGTKSKSKNTFKTDNESNDGFDVKSAIIYSSILERKKFRR